MIHEECSVNKGLPNDGERVLAYGYRTYCCQFDKEDDREWHEVIFCFRVSSYKIKKDIPEDLEETILEMCECYEHWNFDDKKPFDHLIGVTKWKKLHQASGNIEYISDGDFFPPPWNCYENPERTQGWIEFQKEMRKDPNFYLKQFHDRDM